MKAADKYNEDPFKAGAARAHGKKFSEVPFEERCKFKRGVFEVLRSDTFLGWQKDYVEEAIRRQWGELDEEYGEFEDSDLE